MLLFLMYAQRQRTELTITRSQPKPDNSLVLPHVDILLQWLDSFVEKCGVELVSFVGALLGVYRDVAQMVPALILIQANLKATNPFIPGEVELLVQLIISTLSCIADMRELFLTFLVFPDKLDTQNALAVPLMLNLDQLLGRLDREPFPINLVTDDISDAPVVKLHLRLLCRLHAHSPLVFRIDRHVVVISFTQISHKN